MVYPLPPVVTEFLTSDRSRDTAQGVSTPKHESELWVDRYKPKKFIDLIGDEVICILDIC